MWQKWYTVRKIWRFLAQPNYQNQNNELNQHGKSPKCGGPRKNLEKGKLFRI